MSRRDFLRGLVSLPLIGGGVTLIGQPSRPVPLIQAAALPALDDPRQRARYAWEAFSAAMRDVTAGSDGWTVMGGERLASQHQRASTRCVVDRLVLVRDPEPPYRPYTIEETLGVDF